MEEGDATGAPVDIDLDIGGVAEGPGRPQTYSLGAGLLILVARELTGLSQRRLAARVGTSQPTLARLETGNRIPTVRTLLRVAGAAGFELVIGLRRPEAPTPDPSVLNDLGFALIGTLRVNEEDGLADFFVLREPTPFEGPR